jgi:magnesium transporter
MQQHYLLRLQDKVNKRLQVLTVVSSVFMPLMLVTGIYGMNFRHMPELSWTYGYPAALLVMASVAALLFWIFYKKGWFK